MNNTPSINTSTYTGVYDPETIKQRFNYLFEKINVQKTSILSTTRDTVIGSVHKRFGYEEPIAELVKVKEQKKAKRLKAAHSLPEQIRNLYIGLIDKKEQEDKKIDLVVFFDVPETILNNSDIEFHKLISSVSVIDCLDVFHILEEFHKDHLDYFQDSGVEENNLDKITMYWAPWVEIAKDLVN